MYHVVTNRYTFFTRDYLRITRPVIDLLTSL